MERNELKALVQVVEAGSFTAAADRLRTDKAQLSRLISRLERRLGARLLQRSTRALALTEIGRGVYERALAALAALDDIELHVQALEASPRGTLRLSCGVEFGMLVVSGWLNGLLQRYPELDVEADFSGRLVDLIHEGYDLAIRIGELEDSGLAARRLGVLRYGLYASPAYLAARPAPFDVTGLAAHDLLSFGTATWELERGAARAVVNGRSRLRVNNAFALRDAAAAGLGIVRLPRLLADSAVAAGQLMRVLPDWAPRAVPVHALFPSNRQPGAKLRAFIDYASAEFRGNAGGSPQVTADTRDPA